MCLPTGLRNTAALFDRTLVPLAALLLVAGCAKEAPPPPRPVPQVTVMTVKGQTIPYTPSFVAQTESSRQVNIVARVSGFLDRIAYNEGQTVKEGQLLFQLDQKPFLAQLEAAKGEQQSQEARLATATANLNRVKPLAAQNALSQADLDRAQGEFDAATAAVFSAKAKVKEAELNLGYTKIVSPVNGVSSRALQRQGAYVNAVAESANLTYVAVIDPIWVTFSVSQNQLAGYREAQQKGQVVSPADQKFEIELMLPDGTRYPYRGKINFADPSFSQDTGSFLVRGVVPNPKSDLRPGMFVTAHLLGNVRPNAITVPQLAVQQGSNGHLVYVVKEDGTVEVRPVVVGEYYGDKNIVILTGLKDGDRLVVEGALRAVPGQPVKIVDAGAMAADKGSGAVAQPGAKAPDAGKK